MKLIQDLGMEYLTSNSKRKHRFGLYECRCGTQFKAITSAVKQRKIISCGCSKIKHNLSKHRLYGTWSGMMNRCYNKNRLDFKYYGGIGIYVCDEWHNVENFINDMHSTYKQGLTLDRKDNNLGYYKENCRWADRKTQSKNTRILRSSNKTGYRGVSWNKQQKKYVAQICCNGKVERIGFFTEKIDAAKAYNNRAKKLNTGHTLNII